MFQFDFHKLISCLDHRLQQLDLLSKSSYPHSSGSSLSAEAAKIFLTFSIFLMFLDFNIFNPLILTRQGALYQQNQHEKLREVWFSENIFHDFISSAGNPLTAPTRTLRDCICFCVCCFRQQQYISWRNCYVFCVSFLHFKSLCSFCVLSSRRN